MSRTVIVGDIHGEYNKLETLVLGEFDKDPDTKFIFVGDFVDRGPDSPRVLYMVHAMMDAGLAQAVLGNHDKKLLKRFRRYLDGETPPVISEEVETTLAQFIKHARDMDLYEDKYIKLNYNILDSLPYFLELPCGTKIVHACYDAKSVDKPKKKQELKLYGPVDRQAPPREDGLPNRIPWWERYDGRHGRVIFGHYSPADTIQIYSEHAICVDTGVYKTGVLGAYVLETGECVYVS